MSDRSRRSGLRLAAAACLLLAACGAEEEAPAPAEAPAGTPTGIEAEARLTVGTREGEDEEVLDRVVTPFLLPDGRLAVPNGGDGTIRVFGPDGALLESLGGEGDGPGEFATLSAAWPRHDTVEAFDPDLGRITRFLPDGEPATVELELVPSAQAVVPGTLPDGWVLYGVERVRDDGRDALVVHRYYQDGRRLGELARLDGLQRFSAGEYRGPAPLSPKPVFDVHGGEIYVAETLTPAIRVIGPTGTTRRELSWEPGPAPSPEEAMARLAEAVESGAGAGTGESARGIREMMDGAPTPDRIPAFGGFLVDAAGFVWVRPFDPAANAAALGGLEGPGPGGEWTILTPEGAAVGSVSVPPGLEPVQVAFDAVVGIHRDSLGVESVRVHGLRRR